MHDEKAIQWIEGQSFSSISREKTSLMIKILEKCINPKNEKVLILSDTGSEERRVAAILGYAYYLACKRLGLKTQFILQQVKEQGETTSHFFEDALYNLPKNSILLIALSNKLGRTEKIKSYRTFCKKRNHRFLSTPSLGGLKTTQHNNLFEAIDIDYDELLKRHAKLKKILDSTKILRITTPSGTDIRANIENVNAVSADGIYTEPGTGGNLPAGEVYLYPNKTKANGTVIVDVCLRTKHGTRLVEKPFEIFVENGKVVSIQGDREAEELKESLDWALETAKHPENVTFLAEIGIGTNINAIPSGATIIDEKLANTAHIAIGSNYWFGGPVRTIIHLDQVFKNPRIYADNILINKELNNPDET